MDQVKANQDANVFGFINAVNGRMPFWHQVLQLHDSEGLPFEAIYQQLVREPRFLSFNMPGEPLPRLLSFDEFVRFMEMLRRGAAVHGISKLSGMMPRVGGGGGAWN